MTEESAPPETVIDVAATEIPHENASPKRGRSVAVAWLAGLLLVVLALAGTSPYWAPPLATVLPWSPRQGEDRVAALQQQVGALEARVSELAQRKPAPAPDDAAVKQLAARVAALEARPAGDAGATAAVAALKNDVARLDGEIGQNAARLRQLDVAQSAAARVTERELLLAVADLRDAIATSAPYTGQLATVLALGQGRPAVEAALAPLQSAAQKGVPSASMLAQRFEHEVAPAILRARAAAPPEDKSLGGRALAALKSLVVVRRVDSRDVDAASHPVEAAVDTAAAALRKNDLAGAVKALGALQGAPAETAAPWLAEARERLHVDAAVARVTEMVAQHFSPPASPAPTAPPSPAAESPSR